MVLKNSKNMVKFFKDKLNNHRVLNIPRNGIGSEKHWEHPKIKDAFRRSIREHFFDLKNPSDLKLERFLMGKGKDENLRYELLAKYGESSLIKKIEEIEKECFLIKERASKIFETSEEEFEKKFGSKPKDMSLLDFKETITDAIGHLLTEVIYGCYFVKKKLSDSSKKIV